MTIDATHEATGYAILDLAKDQVLERGEGLTEDQLVEILQLPDDAIPAALQLAHEVRLKHCGEDVEVEGIISIKTGGCPEDCHFCSQSGLFDSPVRGVWLDIPELVKAAKETAATGATEFCIVAAVRGPDIKLMNQIKFAIDRIKIDASFIRQLSTSQQAKAIVRAIVALGDAVGVPITAEGVETPEQRAFLAELNCDEIQGYLVGRPSPVVSFESPFVRQRMRAAG